MAAKTGKLTANRARKGAVPSMRLRGLGSSDGSGRCDVSNRGTGNADFLTTTGGREHWIASVGREAPALTGKSAFSLPGTYWKFKVVLLEREGGEVPNISEGLRQEIRGYDEMIERVNWESVRKRTDWNLQVIKWLVHQSRPCLRAKVSAVKLEAFGPVKKDRELDVLHLEHVTYTPAPPGPKREGTDRSVHTWISEGGRENSLLEADWESFWSEWGSQFDFGGSTPVNASPLQCQLHRLCKSQHG